MQKNNDAISEMEREKANIVMCLFDAAEMLGDAMGHAQSEADRNLVVKEYQMRVARIKKRIADISTPHETEFSNSLERAVVYLDNSIDQLKDEDT